MAAGRWHQDPQRCTTRLYQSIFSTSVGHNTLQWQHATKGRVHRVHDHGPDPEIRLYETTAWTGAWSPSVKFRTRPLYQGDHRDSRVFV